MGYRLVLLGPPASGKGTQASALSGTLRVPHVSTGQLFRDTVARGGGHGETVRSFIDKGQLVPDAITIEIVRNWLTEHGAEPEFIFDGFPRTLAQAEALDAFLQARGLALPPVILLRVSEDATVARVLGRLGCDKCGALYHEQFTPPREAGQCDRCGQPLRRRADDTAETVRERLRQYENLSRPVVEHYRARQALHEVDGELPRQQVFAQLLKIAKS